MITKRLTIATIVGLLCGIVCWQLAKMGQDLHWALTVNIILARTLLGFGIGISNLKMSWWLHGIVLGFIFSLPMAFPTLMQTASTEASNVYIFLGTLVMGVIYGFVIELITSILFKAKQV